MRLSRIKLAGFKSFVDPTDLKLPSALVGIVGPNGCGKSNTIDAVRWVMGESSAKHLRGESMDDVIFTGSNSRKPVGQASVELVFDNAEGRLGGEYAKYAEIAVRREVTRDGTSRYLLNNTRCRRRDIRDLFLGTGLGPRSYAIIEQGMISRLIEAKPEDLRVFMEEAAGISKYKERRRETETRIRHTRDNLDRLDDLREEVDKQLDKLKRQANTAERYQTLKADERQKRGELLGLRRREYEAERAQHAARLSEQETELEGIVAELRSAEAAIEQAREQQREASEGFGQVQQEFYRVGAEVARIEQSIQHTRESRAERSRELAETDRALEEARRHLESDSQRIASIEVSIEQDLPAFEALGDAQRESGERLAAAESDVSAWQARRDAWATRNAEAQRSAQVERSRAGQLERSLQGARERLQRLHEERASLDAAPIAEAIELSIAEELEAAEEEASLEQSLRDTGERQTGVREQLKQAQQALDAARSREQALSGRLASLEVLQQAALEPEGQAAEQWLTDNKLLEAPRLGAELKVDAGWERAAEVVLAGKLEAICVDDEAVLARCSSAPPDADVQIVTGPGAGPGAGAAMGSGMATGDAATPLAAHVQGHPVLADLLAGIYVAEDLDTALALRSRLVPGQSVVTRDGLWFGASWLRVVRGAGEDSVLLRAREIEQLTDERSALEDSIAKGTHQVDELTATLREHEARRETVLHSFNDAVRRLSEVRSTLNGARARLEQVQSRSTRLNDEHEEVRLLVERDEAELAEASRLSQQALGSLQSLEAESESLEKEGEALRATLAEFRASAEQERTVGQELAIRVESMKSARQATKQNLVRVQDNIVSLTARRDELDRLFATDDDDENPLQALETQLAAEVATRLASESSLKSARGALEAVESRLREHEQARVRHDARAQRVRETLQQAQLRGQESLVRLKTIDEQLTEHDYVLETVLEQLDENATVALWETELATLEQKIQRLGPINLAAIDEHAEQLERKAYLDTQHADVTEALETLERAIAKIDRETRQRFKETFDAVDEKFKEFFPRLFGGGTASLQLTGDDLLSTGVGVLAQPPGKRVTNIQLLSGGEKALTAVALVFAFFELNPSPFCMLDEVDAPLDDANVGRFCELVKEMSKRVQFIFITHNKVTMEMAEQLMGVTMNEPGVSRLVAVDVHAAVELAGA